MVPEDNDGANTLPRPAHRLEYGQISRPPIKVKAICIYTLDQVVGQVQPSEYRLTIYRYAIIVSFSKYR